MARRDPRLEVGARVGDVEVIAAVPHATRERTWVLTGRAKDGSYVTWTVVIEPEGLQPTVESTTGNCYDVADALSDMLRRARS
jgi:hypothetical protein